ncbi:MAG: type VI secretion system contractile sheath large subunit [Thermodesulfobacteriota bacterium]
MPVTEVPYSILVLAPFAPVPETGPQGGLIPADLSSLDEAAAAVNPRFYIPAPLEACPAGGVAIEIKSLKDFKPDRLVSNTAYLKTVREAGRYVAEALAGGAAPRKISERLRSDWPGLPAGLTSPPAGSRTGKRAPSQVDDILTLVAQPEGGGKTPGPQTKDWPARFDDLLADLLRAIFGQPEFRAAEAAWRGLEVLVSQGQIKEGQGFKLNLATVSLDSLEETLNRLKDDFSALPPHLGLIDLPGDSSPRGLELLEKTANWAEELLTPTACWLGPAFFHLKDWSELKRVPYLKHYLEDAAFAKWRKLADRSAADWLCLTLNRFLGRLPYGRDNRPKGVYFEEEEPLWLSPVWALGALAAQSVNGFGWPSRLTDYNRVSLTNLPLAGAGGEGPAATEMLLSEDRLFEFIEVGLSPLFGPLRKDVAFLPKEATLARGSFKGQLFVARLFGFLFWCRENLAVPAGTVELAGQVKAALARFWEGTGHQPPDDLEVTPGGAGPEGPVHLKIGLTPPRSVWPGASRLEFTFNW